MKEIKEALIFLEDCAKKTVFMNAGNEESYNAGIKLVNKHLRIIKKALKK